MEEDRIISPELEDINEEKMENSLRPKVLDEYIGQDKVKENMKVYIEAAQKRGEPLDHILLYGPPGLGKTTLANIISNEMKSNIKITSGPAIEKPGDLAAILYRARTYDFDKCLYVVAYEQNLHFKQIFVKESISLK